VFARDAVDPGTKLLLLDGGSPQTPGDIVDLGCGYGPIALTLAARYPHRPVWAVDVNTRALELCRENAATNGITNVTVAHPADVPDDLHVAELWSNPPIRIGKPALHELLLGWFGRLVDGGRALLVVHKHLGADSLRRWLDDEGWTTTVLSSRSGYRVIEVRASS
jgi:16S rRNA (guanine1207-N2)-methyltransferase